MGKLKIFAFIFILLSFTHHIHTLGEDGQNIINDNDVNGDPEEGYCDADSCGPSNEEPALKPEGNDDVYVDNEHEDETKGERLPEEINVMITFYNAVKKPKLISTFTTTVKSLLHHATVPLAIHIIGDPESQKLAADIVSENNDGNKKYRVNLQ